jgi:tRNA pseudouridine-54 N-methylase
MGLSKEQKKLVKVWVAAGLKDQEIIRRAQEQVPPFHISQQNISKNYRKHTERKIREIVNREEEESVLRSGLAVRENRIKRLQEYEAELSRKLYLAKDGKETSALINQARGCLDDIAKEMGERREKIDVSSNVHIRDIAAIMAKVYGDD